MKRLLITLPIALAACTTMSDVEKQALADRAITDARNQPKEVHLAYLQCYALSKLDKDRCRRSVKQDIEGRKDANTWEYIRPFDYEAERMGFAFFLKDHGKACSGVDQGPLYSSENNTFEVKCQDGHIYHMRFDSKEGIWSLMTNGE